MLHSKKNQIIVVVILLLSIVTATLAIALVSQNSSSSPGPIDSTKTIIQNTRQTLELPGGQDATINSSGVVNSSIVSELEKPELYFLQFSIRILPDNTHVLAIPKDAYRDFEFEPYLDLIPDRLLDPTIETVGSDVYIFDPERFTLNYTGDPYTDITYVEENGNKTWVGLGYNQIYIGADYANLSPKINFSEYTQGVGYSLSVIPSSDTLIIPTVNLTFSDNIAVELVVISDLQDPKIRTIDLQSVVNSSIIQGNLLEQLQNFLRGDNQIEFVSPVALRLQVYAVSKESILVQTNLVSDVIQLWQVSIQDGSFEVISQTTFEEITTKDPRGNLIRCQNEGKCFILNSEQEALFVFDNSEKSTLLKYDIQGDFNPEEILNTYLLNDTFYVYGNVFTYGITLPQEN